MKEKMKKKLFCDTESYRNVPVLIHSAKRATNSFPSNRRRAHGLCRFGVLPNISGNLSLSSLFTSKYFGYFILFQRQSTNTGTIQIP